MSNSLELFSEAAFGVGLCRKDYPEALGAFHEWWAKGLLAAHGGNASAASLASGIHRNTLRRWARAQKGATS